MPSLNLSSDLQEVNFTPEELNLAMQMKDRDLSYQLLQNTRVGIIRQLAAFTFGAEETLEKDIRAHVYLRGKLDMLDDLLSGILNPTPIPVPENSQLG